MKKFIAIPLLVLYLVAVSGMMVQIHFCGKKMASWNVNKEKAFCCCKDSSKEEPTDPQKTMVADADDCCSNKIITLKIHQDQNRVADLQLQLQSRQFAVPLPVHMMSFTDIPARPVARVYQANAPPGRWQNIPLYKLHSRFTYYG